MQPIYHITTEEAWRTALETRTLDAGSRATEGFIHCSQAHQLLWVVARFFPTTPTLRVVCVDGDRLGSSLRYEAPEGVSDLAEEAFPHVYGPIPLAAVIGTALMQRSSGGRMLWPARWEFIESTKEGDVTTTATNEFWMFVGTYTRQVGQATEKGEGIYTYRFNQSSGEIAPVGKPAAIANPSYLALAPDGNTLYAVNELTEVVSGRPTGAVSAYQIDRASGALTFINQVPTNGTSPCHLVVDGRGKWVLVSNYSSGSVCVLGVGEGGALGEMSEFIQHTGSSVNPQRQGEPHPHSVNLDPANRFVFVPDLGTDKVMIYSFNAQQGKLAPDLAQPWARTRSGAGPRHMDFHPNGRFVFVANELDSSLTVFALDGQKGTMHEVETVSALPEDFEGKSWCADIHVHPNGKTVYISNRGHDSIGVFAIDESSGKLKPLEYVSTQGEFPRNFALSPNGELLLAANQNTGDIFVYRVDGKTGRLTPTGQSIKVPAPVCIKFLPIV